MPTGLVALDTTQYVKVSDGIMNLVLQSHRDSVRIALSDVKPAKGNTAFHELDGSMAPLNLGFTETPVWALATTNRASLSVTEERSTVEVSARGGIGQAVYIQDQTTDILDVPFLADRGTFEIAANTVVDTSTFTAVAGHGILVNEILEFANDATFMQARVLIVAGNVITIDSPFNHAYQSTDLFYRSSDAMLVDGSVTPQIFSIKPGPGQSGDILGFNLILEGVSAMDYTGFGSDIALIRGCLMRVKRQNGDYRNLFNFKTNGQFIVESFGHYFQQKAGGGQHGFLAQVSYGGQHNRGVSIRLDGDLGEELQIVIQDDLTSGNNTRMRMVAYGHELQENF